MSDARAVILGRIREALGSGAAVPEIPRAYRGTGERRPGGPGSLAGVRQGGETRGDEDIVELFCERVADYRATVRRVSEGELPAAVAAACEERGARRLVTPAGFAPWANTRKGTRPPGPVFPDDPPLSARELDGFDGVLTGCALAIAETGTIVLDGGARSGRRAISLVPDYHVCVVEARHVVAGVPDAVAALAEAAAEGRPITLVSGPSATSDIELDRVEGVHGPRTLDVFVVV